jgi:hypothetical protein
MIIWDQEDLADPKNDLCSIYNGKYVDIVYSYKGTWSVMFDNKHIIDRNNPDEFSTREDAIKFLENFLAEKG